MIVRNVKGELRGVVGIVRVMDEACMKWKERVMRDGKSYERVVDEDPQVYCEGQ